MSKLLVFLILLSSCASRHIQRSTTTIDSTVSTETHVQSADVNKSTAVKTTTVKDESGQKVVFGDRAIVDTVNHLQGTIRIDSAMGARWRYYLDPYIAPRDTTVPVLGFFEPSEYAGVYTPPGSTKKEYFRVKDGITTLINKREFERLADSLDPGWRSKYHPPVPNTVTFENGRIKSASGNILEATATSTRLQEQNDSLYTENMILKDSLQTAMSAKHVETVTVEKVVKRTPIGWWLLALVVGFIGGVYCQYKKPLI